LYGVKGNKIWVHSFSAVQLVTSAIFVLFDLGVVAIFGFAVSWILIIFANIIIARGKEAKSWLKALPMFHASLLFYILSIIIDSALQI
ncbi:MAG: prenyltransferase, partial [Promethearchaeota archaeon]